MRYGNFISKLLGLALLLGVLYYYQSVAAERAEALAENRAAVAEVEAYNREILRQQAAEEAAAAAAQSESQPEEDDGLYKDGVYTGTAEGFGGPITVSVTVEGGGITGVEVLSHDGEDPAYYMLAASLTDAILEAQSAEVDTVTGATFSSGGIRQAARSALEQAVK